MEITLEDFKTGWFGLSIALTDEDIARLIQHLEQLRTSKDHFHIRNNTFEGVGGIGDVEFSWASSTTNVGYSIE